MTRIAITWCFGSAIFPGPLRCRSAWKTRVKKMSPRRAAARPGTCTAAKFERVHPSTRSSPASSMPSHIARKKSIAELFGHALVTQSIGVSSVDTWCICDASRTGFPAYAPFLIYCPFSVFITQVRECSHRRHPASNPNHPPSPKAKPRDRVSSRIPAHDAGWLRRPLLFGGPAVADLQIWLNRSGAPNFDA